MFYIYRYREKFNLFYFSFSVPFSYLLQYFQIFKFDVLLATTENIIHTGKIHNNDKKNEYYYQKKHIVKNVCKTTRKMRYCRKNYTSLNANL